MVRNIKEGTNHIFGGDQDQDGLKGSCVQCNSLMSMRNPSTETALDNTLHQKRKEYGRCPLSIGRFPLGLVPRPYILILLK